MPVWRAVRTCGLLFIAMVCVRGAISAHPVPFSYLDLRLDGGGLDGTLTAHIFDLAHDLGVTPQEQLLDPGFFQSKREAIVSLLVPRLEVSADGVPLTVEITGIEAQPDRQALSLRLRFHLQGRPGSIKVRCNLFPYDPEHQTFLNVYDGGRLVRQEILSRNHDAFEFFTGSSQGTLAVIRRFIPAGIYHIFTGPDHILFIIGLLLLGGSLTRLLTIVTAFTIAHSITLSLAALDLVNPPARLIEPAIALSIVYVGIDNLMVGKSGRDMRAWVAFFFGFVHGFGFAGVLKEFGLPRQALAWSLFSFNFGVEIGQACIVVVVASLLAALRKRSEMLSGKVTAIGSVIVILAGAYWFIQRVFF